MMQRTVRAGSVRPRAATPGSSGFRRDRLAVMLALATMICLGSAFVFAPDTQFLMPGPLASVHGAIGNCDVCHAQSGGGKLSWVHGLVGGDRRADSKACLACHKMPNTAFKAHSASPEVLEQSTKRLAKIVAASPPAQTIAFPTDDLMARGLPCATCHQEHQGVDFGLNKIANERCHSCHVVKFDSFDGHHPKFERYPFKRRTRIVYDHAGHFDKHFPEVAKKYPARRIPDDCSTCHDTRKDERVMAVAPFEQTCSACHLDQIVGKERASGPKGIAFLALPGLDLQTLKKRNAPIGEWPGASEAELTPFMKLMMGRDERGRALIKIVDGVNLMDLSGANDDQIKAVTDLVWEIKRLFYRLISGKASNVLADLEFGNGPKLNATLVADLTASLPRDVVASAQQQWLPNLAAEIANGPINGEAEQGGWNAAIAAAETAPQPELSDSDAAEAESTPQAETSETPSIAKRDPPVCLASVFGQCLVFKEAAESAEAKPEGSEAEDAAGSAASNDAEATDSAAEADADASADGAVASENPAAAEDGAEPQGGAGTAEAASENPAAIEDGAEPEGGAGTAEAAELEGGAGKTEAAGPQGGAGATEVASENPAAIEDAAEPEGAAGTTEAAGPQSNTAGAAPAADLQPEKKAPDETDDLLFPNEQERRAIEAFEEAAKSDGAGGEARADAESAADEAQAGALPASSIESEVDAESWAEYGGWYRQDYAILYRPTGHKDKFIYSWLSLTGPRAPKGDAGPAAAVFDFLTNKDAQGSCTKCHSIDDMKTQGRLVNFSPASVLSKQGRFTNFIHQPHFQAVGIGQRIGILENRGCLTCHVLEKGAPYLKSYEQGNARNFASNFAAVKNDLCKTCHNASTARQDCLLCHKYHVNGVITPTMTTKIPAQ